MPRKPADDQPHDLEPDDLEPVTVDPDDPDAADDAGDPEASWREQHPATPDHPDDPTVG